MGVTFRILFYKVYFKNNIKGKFFIKILENIKALKIFCLEQRNSATPQTKDGKWGLTVSSVWYSRKWFRSNRQRHEAGNATA